MVHIYQEAREVLGSFCLSLNAMMIEDCMRNAFCHPLLVCSEKYYIGEQAKFCERD